MYSTRWRESGRSTAVRNTVTPESGLPPWFKLRIVIDSPGAKLEWFQTTNTGAIAADNPPGSTSRAVRVRNVVADISA